MPKKLTTEIFIERAKKIHGDKYDYSLVDYKAIDTKIKIICPIHGIFEQKPAEHIYDKCGCQKCGLEKLAKKFSKTTEQFIEEAKKIYDDKYDYSLVNYKNALTKIKIICPEHGVFEETPASFLTKKRGCKECKKKKFNIILENNISIDYRKKYMELISAAKKNPPKCCFEIHHILPKSLFPNWKNKETNLIKLSYKDHYIAHFYLYKIYNNSEMTTAFFLMSKDLKENNPLLYEEVKNKQYTSLSKKVYCFELNKTYNSSQEAANENFLKSKTDILKICKNKFLNRTSAGYHWCYLEDKKNSILYWEKLRRCS